ncbi:DUF4402 domain-containing protein [Salinimicrobium flavum]|uniref:DUF4402 domain-containing protein n=1 Tax=Salinimicrobium flavum TaxID=1737065 RepID=A0ABW5IZI5_9FLAO
MKKITFILFALIAGTAFGQTDATATASAEIITALKIENTADLNFGKIAPLSDGTSTYVLDNTGASLGSTATLIDATAQTVAAFTITAETDQAFSVTVDPTVTLTGGTGTDITLTTDKNLLAAGNKITSGTTTTLNVGGSLALASGQGSGTYSGTINVSVAYE